MSSGGPAGGSEPPDGEPGAASSPPSCSRLRGAAGFRRRGFGGAWTPLGPSVPVSVSA